MTQSIREELCAITEIKEKRGEDAQTFFKRLVSATGELTNEEWDKLSGPAGDWFNDAVDSANARQDIPGFPDEKQAQPEATQRRRARTTDPEPSTSSKYEPKLKDKVRVVTTRDKEYTGEIVALDAKGFALAINDNEKDDIDLDFDRIKSIAPLGAASSQAAISQDNPEAGDTVQVETMRGKVVMGVIIEITADDVAVKDAAGETHDFPKRYVKSLVIKLKGKAPGQSTAQIAEAGGRRRATPSSGNGAADPAAARTRSTNSGGMSIGTRIRELVIDNQGWGVEQITKQLQQEKLDFKDNTVSLNFNEAKKFLKLLEERKMLR